MPDGVRDDDPALVTTGSRILVSVLERLQLLPVTTSAPFTSGRIRSRGLVDGLR